MSTSAPGPHFLPTLQPMGVLSSKLVLEEMKVGSPEAQQYSLTCCRPWWWFGKHVDVALWDLMEGNTGGRLDSSVDLRGLSQP